MTAALRGHSFSASSISTINKSLDEALDRFARRRLGEPFPYLILDARYEKVRETGIIVSQAVLIAVAVDGEGRRQILGIELANRESRSSWRDFLAGAVAGLKHKRTRPWTQRTNGKAGRLIQTRRREWAYAQPYATSQERSTALTARLDYYNTARPHTALLNLPPAAQLRQLQLLCSTKGTVASSRPAPTAAVAPAHGGTLA